jgi:hypothetical protein
MPVSGTVPVSYGVLPDGIRGTDATVAMMAKMSMGIYGARSTKIRALAINICNAAGVPEKDYVREMVAIHNWVRDNIRYTRDVAGQETLLQPEELAFNSKAGDCDDKSMLDAALLGSIGIPTRFITIGVDQYQFSHVFLQAKPKNQWISLDPIMKDKAAGWEAPAARVKVRKEYPINASEEVHMNGNNLRGLRGLGYVGDNRTWSFLDPEPAPGQAPSPYVVMDSMLDQDAPIELISRDMPVFPQQDVSRMRIPEARWNGPQLRTMRTVNQQRPTHRSAAQSVMNEAMTQAEILEAATDPLNGVGNDLLGPDQLANIGSGIDRQVADAYMQRAPLAMRPEGVDTMFTRPNLVARFDTNDHVQYRGKYALNERPPIRPVTSFAGFGEVPYVRHPGSALPGMGSMSGPGMSELADAAEAGAPAPAPLVSTPTFLQQHGGKIALAIALVVGWKVLKPKTSR